MNTTIPSRSNVALGDTWNLSRLYPSDAEWEKGLVTLEEYRKKVSACKGTFSVDKTGLKNCLDFYETYMILDERLGYYANLRMNEDQGDSIARGRFARYMDISTKGQGDWAWLNPSIQSLPDT